MGIDVSHYQGNIDWAKVKAAGNAFAFAKATQGVSMIDSMFAPNWKNMQNAGVVRGAYHFFTAVGDPLQQAQHYINNVPNYAQADLPPMLDLEDRTGAQQIGKAQLVTNVHQWMRKVGTHFNRIPILYCDSSFASEWLDESFAEYALFIAEYGVSAPRLPSWADKWTFWQYSSTGIVEGVNGHVDQDKWSGTDIDDLMEYVTVGSLLVKPS